MQWARFSLDFPYPARDDDDGNDNSGLQITQPGCQSLNGNMALALARSGFYQYRAWLMALQPSSDLGRIERQNVVISAIIDKAKGDLNPIDLNRVLGALVGEHTKDPPLSGNDLVSLATKYHAFLGSSLQTWTLPTTGVMTGDYGDVEVVQEPQAEQTISQFLGSAAPLPLTTPPLDGNGNPQAASVTATTQTAATTHRVRGLEPRQRRPRFPKIALQLRPNCLLTTVLSFAVATARE